MGKTLTLFGTVDDLSLKLVRSSHTKDVAPGVKANRKHGKMKEEIFLSMCCACDGADLSFQSSCLLREGPYTWLPFCMPTGLPTLCLTLLHPILCTEHPGILCQWD